MTRQITDLVSSAGWLGPLVFVGLYAVLTVLMVPGAIPSLAAGVLFGAVWGTVLTVAGASTGAALAFALARRLGHERLRRRAGARTERLDDWLSRRGFLAVLLLRLVPAVPFNALNYAGGLSSVRFSAYLPATVIGIVPGTVAFVTLGDALGRPGSPQFLIALGAIVVMALAATLAQSKWRARSGRA